MPVFPSSLLRADSESPVACLRPSEEKLAALALSISEKRGEPPTRGPRQELYVGEIRDALMPHGPVCPRCRSLRVVRYGKRGAVQRYKCKGCLCYFTDLTGSVLHRMRRRDLWLDFCLCMVERLSVRDTAARLGISKNTAFAWRYRAISALASADSQTICQGIVEVAQWPIIRSFKGSRPPEGMNIGRLEPTIRRNHLVYRRFYPESRLAALVVAVDRSGGARAGVVLHEERLRDVLSGMMSKTADPCAFRDHASLPARMDWPGRVNWIGRRRGRVNTADRLDPGPLYHVRNARRMLYDFRCWLRPFRGIATKYMLRYFSWYLRIAAVAHTRAGAAAKLFSFEAIATHSELKPG
jgi:transposase-like protein